MIYWFDNLWYTYLLEIKSQAFFFFIFSFYILYFKLYKWLLSDFINFCNKKNFPCIYLLMNQIIFLCYLTIMSICDNILSFNFLRGGAYSCRSFIVHGTSFSRQWQLIKWLYYLAMVNQLQLVFYFIWEKRWTNSILLLCFQNLIVSD